MRMQKLMAVMILVGALLLVSTSMAMASGKGYHKVKYGETLYSIGRYYGVSAHAIAEANNLYNPDYIYAGQWLYIPEYGYYYDHNQHYHNHNQNYHVVRYGETLSGIAYRYGVNTYKLGQHNHIYNLDHIYAGQVLYIPSW